MSQPSSWEVKTTAAFSKVQVLPGTVTNEYLRRFRFSSSTGWIWNNGVWQYKRPNGSLAVNCWEQVKGKWYCFDASGNMRANQWVRNTNNEHLWYYVGSDGAMVTNTSVNGYTINANGECWC